MHTPRHRHRLVLASLALAACTTVAELPGVEASTPLATPSTSTTPSSALAPSDWADATRLVHGLGHRVDVAEVWLDADASAALSLDEGGGVRLWPALAGEPERLEPVVLPIDEPARLSFSRTSAGSFLIAAVDMAQLGRVLEVRREASGGYEVIERMRFGADEPLFELEVLPGGERILALGVDHRLRLFDRSGALLDELAEHGLAPWQLRLVGRGESLAAAVVLAQPTRVRRLSLADDRLQLLGEPRRIYNDRGPNLNDLQLLPGGTHVTAFRRPSAKGKAWTLELIDLASGEVRLLRGEVESRLRSRLHIVDEQRALLEDGSGQGYWVDLRGGVVMPPEFVLPEDHDDLPAEALVTTQRIPLAGSIERERWHASVVAGVRAAPRGRGILLDPIDDDTHQLLGHVAATFTGLSLDDDEVAWASEQGRFVESLRSPGPLRPLAADATRAWSSAPSGLEHAGGLSFVTWPKGGIELRREGASTSLPIEALGVAPSPDARWLAVRTKLNTLALVEVESGREIWQLWLAPGDVRVDWSDSGELLGIVNAGQAVVMRRDGSVVVERDHVGVELVTMSDAAIGEQETAAWRREQAFAD